MTNWDIDDSVNPSTYMQRPEVQINDTIQVVSNNQQGYKKYRVVRDENGNKSLRTLADWDMGIFEEPEDDFGDKTDDEQDGGKRRRRKRVNKTKKSKRSKKSRKHRKTRRARKH